MKVLLINPEIPLSFWSLGESCASFGRRTLMPPLGLLTVAALLPQTWEFRLADLNTGRITDADWQWADLAMVSGMVIQRQGVLRLIREAKGKDKTVVVGGPYATSLSQEVLEAGADFLVRGEGETAIPRLVAALEVSQPGGIIQEDHKPAMATSPVPRFDLVKLKDYLTMGIQTSRGCPFDCEFCDIVSLYGRKPRYKDPEQIIAELDIIYRLGWRGEVIICDDNFIGNKDHARAILNRLIPWMQSHGEPFGFWTQTSVNLGQDQELIDLLTAANFSYVFLGVETPEPEILRSVRKFHNISNPLGQSLAAINANGLSMIASFVMGFDGETKGAGERICAFVEELGLPVVMVNLLQALPKTRLWDRLEQEGRLLASQTTGDSYGLEFNYLPSRPQEEILEEYVQAIDRLYEPSRYLERVYRYYLAMRPTRQASGLSAGEQGPARPQSVPVTSSRGAWRQGVVVVRLIWRQGIRPRHRGQFWKQLLGIYRQNPSRIRTYLSACGIGENLFALRRDILERWRRRNEHTTDSQ